MKRGDLEKKKEKKGGRFISCDDTHFLSTEKEKEGILKVNPGLPTTSPAIREGSAHQKSQNLLNA